VRCAVILLLAAGCGRIGFGGLDGGAGGGGDDAPGGGGDDAPGGGGDGAMPDMMIDAVATISPGCGNTVIIDDNFTTAGTGPFVSVNTSVYTMMETGGVLRIGVPIGTGVNSRAAMQQTAMQSFVGTCAIAELSIAGNAANVRAYLRLGLPAKYLAVYVEAGQLFGFFNVNGTTGTIGPRAYSATTMRFLRLREIGSRNYAVEYGPTLNGAFTMMGSQGGSFSDPSPSSIEIGVTAAGNVATSTTVEFERVLLLGP
jgi:hypothetical protein